MPSAPRPQTDTASTPAPQQQTFNAPSTSAAALANDIAGSVLQALQPVSRDLPVVLSSLILSAIRRHSTRFTASVVASILHKGTQSAQASPAPSPSAASSSTAPPAPTQPVDTTLQEEDATSVSAPAQQRTVADRRHVGRARLVCVHSQHPTQPRRRRLRPPMLHKSPPPNPR